MIDKEELAKCFDHDTLRGYSPIRNFTPEERRAIATALRAKSQTDTLAQGAVKPISMQDVRLMAGEGKLDAATVLNACNAVIRQRIARAPSAPVAKMIKFDVERCVADYEFRGEGGDYAPKEHEQEILIDAIHGVLSEINESFVASQPPATPVETSPTLWGQIAAIYGQLDAEDCAWIDREWAKMRGYILPTDGTSTLSRSSAEMAVARGLEPILSSLMVATLDHATTSRPALRAKFREILRDQLRDAPQGASEPKLKHAIGWALWHPEHGVSVVAVFASEVQAQGLLDRRPDKVGWKPVPVAVEPLPDHCASDQSKCGKLSWPWCASCPHAGFSPGVRR